MNGSELETRILRLLDGELPPEEAAELEEALLADEVARATYEELVLLHNALESRFAASAALQAGVVPVDRLVADQQRRIVRISALAAAAILTIAAVTMWFILAPRSAVEVASLRTTPGAALAVSYQGEGDAPESGVLAEGSVVHLRSGTLESVFLSGVRLVAEAPCRLSILEEDEVRLESGNAWFRVPPPAVGFVARTGSLKVVDLGTEFGVTAAADGRDEVHVLAGSVEASTKLGQGDKKVLVAGAALKVGKDGSFREIEVETSRFPKELAITRAVPIANHSFEAEVIPRDGNRATRDREGDDYQRSLVPSGWLVFQDGRGNSSEGWGVASTAKDSFFSDILAATPDADANDQTFFSAGTDLYQTLPETLQPNSTYVLSVDVGDWRSGKYYDGNPGNPEFRMGTGDRPGENLLEPAETDFPEQIDGQWVRWTATYRTGPSPVGLGQPLRLELLGDGHMSWFDDLRLVVKKTAGGDD